MTPAEVRRLEKAIEDGIGALGRRMDSLEREVKKATNFQVGFQAISKGLTYVLGALAAAAVIYGALR